MHMNSHVLLVRQHLASLKRLTPFERFETNQMRPVIVCHLRHIGHIRHSGHGRHRKAGNSPVVTATYVKRRVTGSSPIVSNALDQSQYTYRIILYRICLSQ